MRTCKICGFTGEDLIVCPECGQRMNEDRGAKSNNEVGARPSNLANNHPPMANGYDYYKDMKPNPNQQQTANQSGKTIDLGVISYIIGLIAAIYQWYVFSDLLSDLSSPNELLELGITIGVSAVLPSLLAFTSALILNIIGYYMNHRYVTLASIVLYGAALLVRPEWGFLAIPSLALQIIAYGNMVED